MSALELPTLFTSIIEIDMYFFGLINSIVFDDKTIDDSDKDGLKQELSAKIEEFRADDPHAKSPAALKYLKSRIDSSVEIYQKHINE